MSHQVSVRSFTLGDQGVFTHSGADYGSSAGDQRGLRVRLAPLERQLARLHNIEARAKSWKMDRDLRSGLVAVTTRVITA
jgi:hypothetical protein